MSTISPGSAQMGWARVKCRMVGRARPTILHFTLAHPIWAEPGEIVDNGIPEIYVRFVQPW